MFGGARAQALSLESSRAWGERGGAAMVRAPSSLCSSHRIPLAERYVVGSTPVVPALRQRDRCAGVTLHAMCGHMSRVAPISTDQTAPPNTHRTALHCSTPPRLHGPAPPCATPPAPHRSDPHHIASHHNAPPPRPALQCSAVSAVQCSAVQCSAVQCSAVQCSAVQ